MTDEDPKRTPANRNPWYVLMTLYGEQEGDELDTALHEKNREAWNTWAGSVLSEAVRDDCASRGITVPRPLTWGLREAEIKNQHRAEMLRRNGTDFPYPGFPEPSLTEEIKFSNVNFPNALWADGLVFPADVTFGSAKFGGVALFDSAWFVAEAQFDSATFEGKAWFGSATFSGNVWFNSATFGRAAVFSSARFGRGALFHSATFLGKALFDSATFLGGVWFRSATFSGAAGFDSATFSGASRFESATFSGDAGFISATFNGFTYFQEAQFGTPGQNHPVTFSDCQFLKPTSFRNAIFHSRYPDLSGAVLHDKTEFTARPENWPSSPPKPHEEAKESCARIRHAIAKQGLPEEEHFFYRREMGFACRIGPLWQRLPYLIFGLLSDFGASIARPVQALLLLWVGPAVFFFGQAQTGRLADYPQIGRALALSFANIFNFLGFHRTFFAPNYMQNLPAFLQVLSGFQTVVGVVLLFFLGLGLRTRFRLR